MIPCMRRARALVLVLVTASLAAGGGTLLSGRAALASRAPAVVVSGFTLDPDVADPACNRGRGVRLTQAGAGNSVVADATMPDGSTLIAFSNIYPGRRSAVLRSVTHACAPNPAFGSDGVATITVPLDLRLPVLSPKPAIPIHGLWVEAIAPARGGRMIVAGRYEGAWVVAALTARGTVDQTFGTQGWVVLPFPGEVTAILGDPSGRIVIAGDNGGGGCCTVNSAVALPPSGQLEGGFGSGGRAALPTGEDSGVGSLQLEPNGDILAEVGYGNMGCWGIAVAMLTPTGQPEPLFAARLHRFWATLRFNAFVGDVNVDSTGFTLVGTGQGPCAAGPAFSAPSATGVMARFRTDGTLVGSTVLFPSRMYGSVLAFPDHGVTVLFESPYADPTQLGLIALRHDGSTYPGFGKLGRAQIRTPWHGSSASLETRTSILEAGSSEICVIATESGHSQVQLIRVRLCRERVRRRAVARTAPRAAGTRA
jgi:hypothetical protein